MARHQLTLRIFRILHYLETTRSGLRVGEIHDRLKNEGFDVHKRTVHRDLEALQEAHFSLITEGTGNDSHWKLSSYAEVKQNVQFSYKEIFALYVARKSLVHLHGTPIFEIIDLMFLKIEKLMGTNCDAFQEFLSNLSFRPQFSWHTTVPSVILDTVYQALEEGNALRILYKAEAGAQAGQIKERLVGPECLYFANGGIYLIAKDLQQGEARTYALTRMSGAELQISHVYDKEGHLPEKIFAESFGLLNTGEVEEVKISISGPVGAFVAERRWHQSQQVVQSNEGLLLKLRVKINDELARWVLGLGPTAKVLEPVSLQGLVEKMASQVANRYQTATRKQKAS